MAQSDFYHMPTPITFTFTDEERQAAMEEGARRQRVNEEKGLRGRNNGPRFGKKALDVHLLGAAGEMAVASHLGLKHELYRETEAKRGSCDLPGIDVKTRSKHCRDLIVQKRESPEKLYVLVTIEKGTTLIHGWCKGEDAMKDEYWADYAGGRPAYFMPQSKLRPMEELQSAQAV
jgi:hypothetical protein